MQITNDVLQPKVVAFQNFPTEENEREVVEAIKHLAGQILTYYAAKFDLTHVRFDDVTCHALERLWHFDPAKGKAFHYFTTVMGCFIRQAMRREHGYAKLRKKYEQHLTEREHVLVTEPEAA